jgi:methylthioribose-1-phosphate isomerase
MMKDLLEPIRWEGDELVLLDQTLLPTELKYLKINTAEEMWEAIRVLRVRGAPVIGLAAAFGMYLGLRVHHSEEMETFRQSARKVGEYLCSSRPTAVNLQWAVERIIKLIDQLPFQGVMQVSEVLDRVLAEAKQMIEEDHQICLSIGQHGLELLADGARVLTHCNAGGLVTAKYGTALAPVYAAREKGKQVAVFADETRPLLQGARLTAFELQRAGVPVTLICDNMAATVMKQEKVDLVIVGADRVAANGDFANKIGTYGVAILAKEHGIPFYCAAPLSSFVIRISSGMEIPIEERSSTEITHGFGKQTAPDGVHVYNPAFDVTPARYVTAFITEKGLVRAPFEKNIAALFEATKPAISPSP